MTSGNPRGMKLSYRIFGVRYRTGHTDWHLIRQGLLAILFATLFFWSLDQAVEHLSTADELRSVRAKLEIRERQIIRCLNGQAVGYVAIRDTLVYTICHPAEEIVVSVAN